MNVDSLVMRFAGLFILASLALNHGNQTHTAQQLEIGSATLYRKLKSYGVLTRQQR